MKDNFTFDELSRVFAIVSKIDAAAKKQIEAENEYNSKNIEFDSEFKKCEYTFINAPKELHVLFDEKCALSDVRDRAERKAYKLIKEFAGALEIGMGAYEWFEDEVAKYVRRKDYFKVEQICEHCKYLASIAAHRIKY